MLPAMTTSLPAALSKRVVKAVTVVLPLVPVMASTCGAYPAWSWVSRNAWTNRLNSVPTHKPASIAARHTGATSVGDKPGLLNTARMPWVVNTAASNSPAMNCACGAWVRKSAKPGGSLRVSITHTRAPRWLHQRAMAKPDWPKPSTSTAWSCKDEGWSVFIAASRWTSRSGTTAW